MGVVGEQRGQAVLLFVSEQVRAGVQGPSCAVERVGFAAAVPAGGPLDTATAPVQRLAGQANHMERVHETATASGSPSVVAS